MAIESRLIRADMRAQASIADAFVAVARANCSRNRLGIILVMNLLCIWMVLASVTVESRLWWLLAPIAAGVIANVHWWLAQRKMLKSDEQTEALWQQHGTEVKTWLATHAPDDQSPITIMEGKWNPLKN